MRRQTIARGLSNPFKVLLFALFFCGAFLVFSAIVNTPFIKELDRWTMAAVISIRTPKWTSVFMFVQQMGNKMVIFPMITIIGLYLALFKKFHESLFLFSTAAGAFILDGWLKSYFHRPRPSAQTLILENGFGYPSRHTMLAMALYGSMSFLMWTRLRGKGTHSAIKLLSLTIALVLLVGFSMIYLGAHYPADIFGGLLAGAAWLCFCCAWFMHIKE
ncbi:phosphatase PAP2 family protein [Fictibacillus sp. NRS-1165]|uniref:phosphatase PAP2 family protein n=1 Tax=Fictibacillus sp. NRS-1165 TaxID=3144463 RepID=UPI003D1C5015